MFYSDFKVIFLFEIEILQTQLIKTIYYQYKNPKKNSLINFELSYLKNKEKEIR